MAKSETKSLNLVLMQIVGPALIMLMVGSLVFFGIEVLYRGPHAARLYWVMGLFTFASVLVSRISVDEGRERAQLFGLGLGVATFIASTRLVEFDYTGGTLIGPLVILALIATVMWTSAKLTWDCTVVDNSRDPSAMGLLELFRRQWVEPTKQRQNKVDDKNNDIIAGAIRWVFGTSQRNSPGLWVFYFALLAFPIFGFGQWFVQPASKGQAFFLFAIYLGSTLCLLMTTSLLGLERYLAKRMVHVPNEVAANWLLVGGVFAALVMVAILLVPKPASSSSIQDWLAFFTSPNRATSKLAVGENDQDDDPNAVKQRIDKDGGRQGDQAGDSNTGDSKEQGDDGDQGVGKEQDNREGSRDDASNNPANDSESANQDRGEESERDNDPGKSNKQRSAEKDPAADNEANPPEQETDRQNEPNRQADPRNANQPNRKLKNEAREQPPVKNQRPKNAKRKSGAIEKFAETISKSINMLVYGIGGLALLFLAWAFRKELLAFFRKKKPDDRTADDGVVTPDAAAKPLPPFSAFANPFANGKAKQMSPKQLVDYTLDALEAWARGGGWQREPDQTAEEFVRNLAANDNRIGDAAADFAKLYSLCAFSREKVSRQQLKPLVNLWRHMEQSAPAANDRVAVPN